jgi:hypothetical protein
MDKYTAIDILFVLSPVLGYLPQIISRRVVVSPILCTLFILSNILKIFHHIEDKYSSVLLVQSIFVILLHFVLVHFNRNPLSSVEAIVFKNRITRQMYRKYGLQGCVAGIVGICILTIHMAGTVAHSYSGCGLTSSAIELLVNLMQFYFERENKKMIEQKGVGNRSPVELYVCWSLGDAVRVWYLRSLNAPLVYIVTVGIQVVIDLVLIYSFVGNK